MNFDVSFNKRSRAGASLVAAFAIAVLSQSANAANPCPSVDANNLDQDAVVNVYSARKEELILPLLQNFQSAFQNHFGNEIQVNLITGQADGLLKRIELEGKATPSDVFITVDAGRLHRAKHAEVLQPIPESVANKVPSHLRDNESTNDIGYWVGLSQRARPIFFKRDKGDQEFTNSYEMLAHPDNAGRLCIRSSSSIYNQSLVASMIPAMAEQLKENDSFSWLDEGTLEWAREQMQSEATDDDSYADAKVYVLAWAKQLVDNFARPPTGGDTDQILAVAAGQCTYSLSNSYYFGRLVAKNAAIADDIGIIWPNQHNRGSHVNVSGAGITKHAKHPNNAQCLLDFMLEPDSQEWYAQINYEYPVSPEVPWSDILKNFGLFDADDLDMSALGVFNSDAVKIMDRAGWR